MPRPGEGGGRSSQVVVIAVELAQGAALRRSRLAFNKKDRNETFRSRGKTDDIKASARNRGGRDQTFQGNFYGDQRGRISCRAGQIDKQLLADSFLRSISNQDFSDAADQPSTMLLGQ